ncbi:MAG TPA: MATE family efflux transporter [Firmicutes bacterium]|nr:MATE family efflux transporter [Bacillota bacterium]
MVEKHSKVQLASQIAVGDIIPPKQNHSAEMGTDKITSLLIRFSMPATFAMAVMASYNIVDTIFVGRLGGEAIAALSISFPIQMLFGALAVGTGIGAGSFISRSLGAGRYRDAVSAAGQSIILSILFGLFAAIAGLIFLEPLLVLFGTTPEIMAPTKEYMSIIIGGAGLIMLIMILNHVVRAEGNAILPMKVMVISAVTNIILDPVFIFTLGMGIRGAAVATILAKIVGVVMLLSYFYGRKSSLKVRLAHLRPCGRIILDIYRVGLPSLLNQVAINVSLVIVNRILGDLYGYAPIAVMGLLVRFQMFAFMPVIGIAQGVLPIVGFNFGAKKMERIGEAVFKGSVAATVLVTAAGIALYLFPEFFLRFFTGEDELIKVGMDAVRIMVLTYPLIGMHTMAVVFFQGIGKGTTSLFLALMRQFILYIPFILLMPRYYGLTGFWLATPLADLLSFIVVILLVSREFNRHGILLIRWPRSCCRIFP